MHVVGLITEYNPFHNGHLHHLQESLRVTGADASVAVMSGHFLQRGEPAMVDKWVRTEMALAAGVDLVFELPFPFACNSAPHFASGAVQSLNALGTVESLCFGSEAGDLNMLDRVASILIDEEEKIETLTTARLREGINYPTARAAVLQEMFPELPTEEIAAPNNILGLEYLKALRHTKSTLMPYTIKRIGAGYHDNDAVGAIASATGIRQRIAAGDEIDTLIPKTCYRLLESVLRAGQSLDPKRLFVALQSHLLQDPESLQDVYLVDDGMDKRLGLAALEAKSFAELVQLVKSKQWTLTRVQRILNYVLMKAKAAEMQAFVQTGPLYLRLLGHSDTGRKVLARARKKKTLPIVSDPARSNNTLRKFYRKNSMLKQLAEAMMQYDLRATQLYGLLQSSPSGDYRNQDFYQPVRHVQ